MPLYEYECRDCGKKFETLVRGTTEPACPSCRSTELMRLLSVFAVGAREPSRGSSGPGPCGACGDPRGPGACSLN